MTNAIDFLEGYLKGRGRMKAKDTVMKMWEINKLYEGQPDDIHEGMDSVIAEAQAEISFEVGYKQALLDYKIDTTTSSVVQ